MDQTIDPRLQLILALKREREAAPPDELPNILAELRALQEEQLRRLEQIYNSGNSASRKWTDSL